MGIIGMILGLIAIGAVIVTVIALTWFVWKQKVRDRFNNRRTNKVISARVKEMERGCTNRTTLDELDKLEDEGYTYVMADMDSSGEIIGDVELIKDTENDRQVTQRHGREGIVVIER